MPTYSYHCACGLSWLAYRTLASFQPHLTCECGLEGDLVITAPVLVKAQSDCRYDSPIDGTPITSHAQRIEDMKRHNCIEYEPGMKQDQQRRVAEDDAKLDRSIEQHVERVIEKMPTKQRNKLASDILDRGETIEHVRQTVEG